MDCAVLSSIGAAAGGPWPQWSVIRDSAPTTSWGSDNLADRYKKLSEDESKETKEREAAKLFCVAEEHLVNDENSEAALETARRAVELFEECDNKQALADAHRLVTFAHRAQAEELASRKEFGWMEDWLDENREAMELAEARKTVLKEDTSDKYGNAVAILTAAEFQFVMKKDSEQAQAEAISDVEAACKLLRRVNSAGAKQMEGNARLVRSSMCASKGDCDEAEINAMQALELFTEIKDSVGEAKAYHYTAVAHALRYDLKEALELEFKALNLFRELELTKLEVLSLYTIAKWNLARERPRDAVSAAREALVLLEDYGTTKNWEVAVLRAVVEAHIARGEAENGVKAAKRSLELFRNEKRDKWTIALTLDALAHAYLASGQGQAALEASDEAWASIADDLQHDIATEAIILRTWCQLLIRLGEDSEVYNEALQGFQDAAARYQELKDTVEQGSCQLVIADIHYLMRAPKEALSAAKKALDVFKMADDPMAEAAGHLGIARARRWTNDFEESEDAAEEARVIFTKVEAQPALVAGAHTELAQTYEAQGKMKEAVKAQKKAYMLLKQTELIKTTAEALLVMARMHSANGDQGDAYRAALDARESAAKCSDKHGELQALLLVTESACTLLQGYAGHGKSRNFTTILAKAMQCTKDAEKLCEKLGEETSKAVIIFRSAQLCFLGGRVVDAMALCKQVMPHFEDINDKAAQGHVKVLMAQVSKHSTEEKDKDEAVKFAQEGLELLTEVNDQQGAAVARSVLKSLGIGATLAAGMDPMMMMQMMGMMPQGGMAMAPAGQAGGTPGRFSSEKPVTAVAVPKGPTRDSVKIKVLDAAMNAVSDDGNLDGDIALMDAGVDSLAAVSLRNELAKEFSITLPAAMIFDFPTINELTEHIFQISNED
mmetsp:Transcript_70257/g.121735  ORF Transcript_70257/g.121735 Transcript_70257/m.121735 type:complete len:896 (-) Transcript_70257:18-2705(-)